LDNRDIAVVVLCHIPILNASSVFGNNCKFSSTWDIRTVQHLCNAVAANSVCNGQLADETVYFAGWVETEMMIILERKKSQH
jgi:hypothetical protein